MYGSTLATPLSGTSVRSEKTLVTTGSMRAPSRSTWMAAGSIRLVRYKLCCLMHGLVATMCACWIASMLSGLLVTELACYITCMIPGLLAVCVDCCMLCLLNGLIAVWLA